MDPRRCPACRRPSDGSLCPDCAPLAAKRIVVNRSLAPLAAVAGVLLLVHVPCLLLWRYGLYSIRFLEPALLLDLLVGGWLVRELTRPHRVELDGELVLHRPLGRATRIPLNEVRSDAGALVHLPVNRRYGVGELQFGGAGELHRALRVRQALLRRG